MRAAVLFFLVIISSTTKADDQLWEALRTEPNLIVFMRHAHSRGGHPLTWDESGNCRGESRLTRDGEALAEKIGKAFTSRGIEPTVISSPMCRCLETAQVAFGRQPITNPDLRETASADTHRMQAFENVARSLISSSRGTVPIIFISHRPNIDQITMELIKEGDLLIAQTNESGDIDLLGKITIE